MEFRRIRLLAAVAEHQSIGRAARALQLAQPALSRQIRALEQDVGVALLERTSQGARLSPAGVALVTRTSGLDARLAAVFARVCLAAAGRSGLVRLALGRLALDDREVSFALSELRRAEPAIEVTVLEIGTPLHTRALLHDDAELTIGVEESPHNTRLERRTLRTERINCALIPASHPLAASRALVPSDLAALPLLMPGRSLGWVFPGVRRAVSDLGIDIGAECESLETAYALVAAGRGWVASAERYVEHAPAGTVARRLRGLDVEIPVVVRWRRGASTALVRRTVQVIARAFREGRQAGPDGDSIQRRNGASAGARAEPDADPSPGLVAAGDRTRHRLLDELEARHLRAFVTVTNEGSLGDAARRLDLTKSAVSRQVSALERIGGAVLLERRRGLLSTTTAGAMLRDEAAAVLQALDDAVTGARLAARGIARVCTLAVVPTPLAESRVRALLSRAPRDLPQVGIELRELGSGRALAAVGAGVVDAALILQPDALAVDERFASQVVGLEPIDTVLVSAQGPLGGRASLVPADLAALPFLYSWRAPDSRRHDHIVAELRRSGIDPLPGAAFDGPRAVWQAVADGQGWTIGAHSMRALPPPGIVTLPVIGLGVDASLRLVHRRDEQDPHVRAFVALALR